MKIKLSLVFLALVITNLISAQTASVTDGCAPLTVNFTAPAAAGAGPYYWDFGNVTSSPNQNPTNPYISAGTYTVIFRQGVGGAIVGNSIIIHVYNKPSMHITASPFTKGCAPLNVSLTANVVAPPGITVNTYSWGFGDGTGGGTGNPKNHSYASGGVFDVTLSINTSSVTCDTTRVFPKFISTSIPPIAAFTTSPDNPAIACNPPYTVTFTNTSSSPSSIPLTYAWTGPVTNKLVPDPQTYGVVGNFPTKLTVTDTNNCSSSVTQTTVIGKPTAKFTMPDTVCINIPFSLNNTSPVGVSGNYQWTFDAGASTISSTAFEPNISYSTSGIHKVILKTFSPSGSCSDSDTISIFIENPIVHFTSNPTYSCSEPRSIQFTGTSTSAVQSWFWVFGDLKTSIVKNPNHIFSIPDSIYSKRGRKVFDNTLTITTTSGCIATYTAKDTIHLVWARFQPDTAQGCAPLKVTFYDSSKSNTPTEPIVSWDWNYGDGSPIDHRINKNPHPHTYATPGKYNVVLIATNNHGCNDTSYAITISVGGPKTFSFTADKTSICPGETVAFTLNPTDTTGVTGWNYSSNGEFLSDCFQNPNPSFVFDDSTGLQSITLTADYNGCLTTVTKTNYITVKGPIAHFDYLTTCGVSSYAVQFTDKSESATGLSWDFDDGTPLVTTTGVFTHTYTASGDYQVILTATGSCAPSKDTAIVHVKKIKSNFSSDTPICYGVQYKFDASASTDVYGACYSGYTWIFSDSTVRPITTALPISQISFTTTGNQTVGLVVKDINGCVDTIIHTIKVYQTLAKYTISDAIICTPDTIQFTDISQIPPGPTDTTITKWAWTFGDGAIDSVQNPKHIYPSAPSSPIVTSLTFTTTLGCVSTSSQNISIYNLSGVSAITASPSPNICLGSPITFSASNFTTQHASGLSYKWDFSEGPDVTGNNNTHTYLSSGAYTVKLYYTEIASGCNDSTTKTVTVQDYPTAGFYTNPIVGNVLCAPTSVSFYDSSKVGIFSMPLNTLWKITTSNDSIINTANASPDGQTFATHGTYSVTLTAITTNGCADTLVKPYLVVAPRGDFDMDTASICKGDSIKFTGKNFVDVVNYTWFYGDGDTSVISTNPTSHVYNFLPPSGNTKATLIVKGQGGCAWPVAKLVNIHYVKADFRRNSVLDNDSTICFGTPILLIDSSKSADVYSWTLGDNSTSTTPSTISHFYKTTGTFSISLAVRNSTYGCKDTMTKVVIVNPVPQVTAIGDSVCMNDTAKLSVTIPNPAFTYSWKPIVGLSNANIYNPTFIASTAGNNNYYVTATIASSGCTTSDTAVVLVPAPLHNYTWDTSIVIGQYVNLPINNQNGMVLFDWTPTAGLSCLTCSNPQVQQPLYDITYSSFMHDIVGCPPATAIFNIHIFPETTVKLPSTFTPNGDGVNDIIYVDGWGIKDLVSFEIYNRWGELVFKTSELKEGWDGYYKGMLQNNDTYVYKVNALSFRDKEMVTEGHINLMR